MCVDVHLSNVQVDPNSRNTVTAERQTFYCVPIPGENAWVKEISFSCLDLSFLGSRRNKAKAGLYVFDQPVFVFVCIQSIMYWVCSTDRGK